MKELFTRLVGTLAGYRTYLIAAAVVLALITGAWYGGKWQGAQEQKVIQANEKAAATIKGVQTHDKVQREVKKLSDPDLDADLAKWMRD